VNVKRIHIKNFKSVVDLSLDLASINVFIGENGSGKSNILEALAFAAAAAADKVDNEFLVSRGIRVAEPRFMRPAFTGSEEGGSRLKSKMSMEFEASSRSLHQEKPRIPSGPRSRGSSRLKVQFLSER
jgi:AAA15 family ATPase/GTPase